MTEAKKEVAKKKKQEVSTETAAPRGFASNIDPKDLQLPRIELLQALSPAVTEGEEGMVPGIMVNSLTKELLGEDGKATTITPIKVEKNFIKWRPREEGGGIDYRTSDPEDPRVKEDTKWGKNGEKPACTSYLNFLCLVEGQDMPMVLSCAMTNYKVGRDLLTMAFMSGKDCFAYSYALSSKKRTNNYGTFYTYSIKRAGPSKDDTREKAEQMYKMFVNHSLNFETESSNNASSGTSNYSGEDF